MEDRQLLGAEREKPLEKTVLLYFKQQGNNNALLFGIKFKLKTNSRALLPTMGQCIISW